MIRNSRFLRTVLRIHVGSVVHVGADKGQDRSDYIQMGAVEIIWCEADPTSGQALKEIFPEDQVNNSLYWDSDGLKLDFYQTNFSAQNSAVKLSKTSTTKVERVITLTTRTLSKDFGKQELQDPVLLNLDVQGAELRVLNGALDFLPKVKYLICEIAIKDQGYEIMPKEAEIDKILMNFGFRKSIARYGWGLDYKDQLYIKCSHSRILAIQFLDIIFDRALRVKHLITHRHLQALHYHCLKCNF